MARKALIGWFIFSGGATGILIGVIILEWLQPGHPIYREFHEFFKGILRL